MPTPGIGEPYSITLVGADKQSGSNVEANRLGGSRVDRQHQALPCETALLPGCRAGGVELHQAGSIRVRPARLVMPDPPVVRRGLGIALRRVLPLLLTPERGDVEVGPGAAHRLVAAVVDEVGTEHAVAVTDERICAMPLIDSEVLVEVVGDRVPWDQLPSMRAFRRAMSGCGARETKARVVSRTFRWAGWATWSPTMEQPMQA